MLGLVGAHVGLYQAPICFLAADGVTGHMNLNSLVRFFANRSKPVRFSTSTLSLGAPELVQSP